MPSPEPQVRAEMFASCLLSRDPFGRTTFYQRAGKRAMDVCGAILGIVFLAPLFFIVVLAIKATSRGPVLFRQKRVGRDGRCFTLVKFRSMTENGTNGPSITALGDTRVTRLGSWLRSSKIDELPQLWNVIKGEMSLVGPRPEVEKYVKEYSLDEQRVLKVRPGITDPASIAYRHEERILSQQLDPESYYRSTVLHKKLLLNLQYIERISWYQDVLLILKTIRILRSKAPDSPIDRMV